MEAEGEDDQGRGRTSLGWSDKALGSWTLRGFLCRIYKVSEGEWTPEKGGLPSPEEFRRQFHIE